MLLFVLATFFAAFFVSLFATPIVRRAAPILGLVDLPGDRKVHVTPTPMGGGIAVFLGLVIPIGLLVVFQNAANAQSAYFGGLISSLSGDRAVALQTAGIVGGAAILFATGLADDRWNLSWKLRLGIQASVALGVTLSGVKATVFVAQPWIGIVVTVLWILVLTNAMNFLDNMDGLSAGIGIIAALMSAGVLLVMVRQPHEVVVAGLLLLAGSLGGFLCWNRPPATIFMGDSGSNLVGFLLATFTVAGTFYEHSGSRHVILAPLCVLAIPLYDFVTVIWIRLRSGRSPFHGDKSHFSHRLVELGLRPSRAVLTIHLATLMTGLGGLLLYKVTDWTGAWLIIALIFCVLSLVSILETVGRRSIADEQKRVP
ncbi:MraY family glycosyltransferase [Fuerstiella marisgermanici]|uniref:Putative undecaprenyl-phosphate N-acetylglucosaminyl 1-phosphate transferase n=1 Tax=Fuerstiella marisgermanici TaxID=1891926 RepID=A0A1P8WRY6_9PLAN|nr:MraY family glycosyltransferase [Fuerstiella marisgermanici]APZ96817.1 putative undecaprenyl-phosphate N-acetylglucosaminyl 1-phosphate transferase [Fuerstiella marisgermanici]